MDRVELVTLSAPCQIFSCFFSLPLYFSITKPVMYSLSYTCVGIGGGVEVQVVEEAGGWHRASGILLLCAPR